MALKRDDKQAIIAKFAREKGDTGSPEVQIALLSISIDKLTGHVAQQASGAVMAQYGDTVVLATVVGAPLQREVDYFPLGVEYMEKLYAGGRIKGSRWVKREGRPTDEEILTARLIDRSIRPLFPKTYKKEVQVIVTVLSVDMENSPDIVAGIAVSAAIASSPLPWKGPIGIVRVGMKDGKYFTNPLDSEMDYSDLDLIVSGTKDAIVMIEAGAKQVNEDQMRGAIEHAHDEAKSIISFIEDFVKAVKPEKEKLAAEEAHPEIEKKVKELAGKGMKDLIALMAVKEGAFLEF